MTGGETLPDNWEYGQKRLYTVLCSQTMAWQLLCKAARKNREAQEERAVNGKNKPRLEGGIAFLAAWRFNILSMPAASAVQRSTLRGGRSCNEPRGWSTVSCR